MKPRFSVIVPVFNGAGTLGRALDSLTAQSWQPEEVIVVDDGSSDGSAEVAEAHPSVTRLIRQDNQGVSVARNRGVAEARGDWLAFLDADDLYFPDRLRWHGEWIAEDPGLDFLTGDQEYRSPDGALLRTHTKHTEAGRSVLARAGQGLRVVMDQPAEIQAFVADHFGDTHTLSVPRSTFLDIGGYPPGRAVCEDVSLLVRLTARSRRIGVITRPMAAYYVHPASATRRDPVRAQRETVEALSVLRAELAGAPASVRRGLEGAMARARMDHAVALLRSGRRAAALGTVWPNFLRAPGAVSARQVLSVLRGL